MNNFITFRLVTQITLPFTRQFLKEKQLIPSLYMGYRLLYNGCLLTYIDLLTDSFA